MIDVTNPRTKLISIDEASQIMGVSRATAYGYVKRGFHGRRLEVVLVGGSYRTTREAIREFVRLPSFASSSARADKDTDEILARYGID